MTPQQIRDLADRQDHASPDAALFVAPVLRELAGLYEAQLYARHLICGYPEPCKVCQALKRLEELQL